MHDVEISEDKDEAISEADFLEFVRRTLIADLPAETIPIINSRIDAILAKAVTAVPVRGTPLAARRGIPGKVPTPTREDPAIGLLDREQVGELLLGLGFHPDATTLHDLFDEVDVDGDGAIDRAECLAAIGILKQDLLELLQLERSFTRFREKARRTSRPLRKEVVSMSELSEQSRVAPEDHFVHASDLVAALGVTTHEAEEIMFIADLNEDHKIDFTEFKQCVMSWSSC